MSWMTTVLRLAIPTVLLVAVHTVVAAEPVRRQPTPGDEPEAILRKYLESLDRMDADGARAIVKQAAERSHGPIVELMIRHNRLLAAEKAMPAWKDQNRPAAAVQRNSSLYTVTYNVADLVMPLPEVAATSTGSPAETKSKRAALDPDFDSLVELISSTIKPTTWDAVGGPGSITPFKANLSIIVSQTQEVHREIVELLEQLRRLQDISIMLETKIVTAPEEMLPEHGTMLDSRQVKRLTGAASKTGDSMSIRRITMMNGQQAAFLLPADREHGHGISGKAQAVVSNDRRRVRLTVVLGEKQLECGSVNDGHTMVVDLGSAAGDSRKDERGKKDAKPAVLHRLLLLTPRIIIAEEEEERLGVSPGGNKG
jgi:hypothetical protein